MAEMDTSSGGGHKKKGGVAVKSKKMSTRVDLTPMVDLGFLLITFFMFATTLSQPKAAKFRVPKDDVNEKDMMKASKAGAMHALFGPSKDSIYYYEGDNPIDEKKGMSFVSLKDFRKKIMNLRTELKNANLPDSIMILSIKPLKGASYGTFMAVFDEVAINAIRTSVKVKPKEDEIKVINAYNEFNKLRPLPTEGYKPLPKNTVGDATEEEEPKSK